nr:MAG TPA: hypothetical protein [Bacteriophage sp.]
MIWVFYLIQVSIVRFFQIITPPVVGLTPFIFIFITVKPCCRLKS